VFAATAALNGVDSITDFTVGAAADVLSFLALLTASDVLGGATSVASTLGVSIAASLNYGTNTANIIQLNDIQTLTTANFGAVTSATVVQTAISSNYVVIADVAADVDAIQNVYYVSTSAGNVATVTLVGTMTEGTLVAANIA